MAEALSEVRKALLSADVHFKVAREFCEKVGTKAVGTDILKSVTPFQQLIKIVSDELGALLGAGSTQLSAVRPLKIMLVGLHGSGKTTTAAKLANLLRKQGLSPALIACDIYRPAAIDQLETLAKSVASPVYLDRDEKNAVSLAKKLGDRALSDGANALVFDTAGRLQIDAPLIAEISEMRAAILPAEVLLVADSALGQEAVSIAKAFNGALGLTGAVLTKLDGDARGGAALSIKAVSGVPIKFVGTGEKPDEFEVFHPDRMAGRILGMGDIVSLVEKAQETLDGDDAKKMAEKFRKAEFDFEDFLAQMRQIKKLGSLGGIMKMIPGMGGINIGNREERMMDKAKAIILSMTPKERRNPSILNARRKLRIAGGSGTEVRDINLLLKRFEAMRKVMKIMKGGKGRHRMEQIVSAIRNRPF